MHIGLWLVQLTCCAPATGYCTSTSCCCALSCCALRCGAAHCCATSPSCCCAMAGGRQGTAARGSLHGGGSGGGCAPAAPRLRRHTRHTWVDGKSAACGHRLKCTWAWEQRADGPAGGIIYGAMHAAIPCSPGAAAARAAQPHLRCATPTSASWYTTPQHNGAMKGMSMEHCLVCWTSAPNCSGAAHSQSSTGLQHVRLIFQAYCSLQSGIWASCSADTGMHQEAHTQRTLLPTFGHAALCTLMFTGTLQISSAVQGGSGRGSGQSARTTHFSAFFAQAASAVPDPATLAKTPPDGGSGGGSMPRSSGLSADALRARSSTPVDVGALYQGLGTAGLQYGPCFRLIRDSSTSGSTAAGPQTGGQQAEASMPMAQARLPLTSQHAGERPSAQTYPSSQTCHHQPACRGASTCPKLLRWPLHPNQ